MKSWDLRALPLRAHAPEILASGEDARVIALELPAGESLEDHQVHEQAWVSVVTGEVEITAGEQQIAGGPGLVVQFEPGERHAVRARETSRLLLMLTPWPGPGHPGAMSLDEKASARRRAADHV